MSGSSLLSHELAAERLEMHDASLGPFTYGLGIMQTGGLQGLAQLFDQQGRSGRQAIAASCPRGRQSRVIRYKPPLSAS